MDCGKIIAGLVAGSCGKLPVGGTGTRAIVINYSDVDKKTSALNEGVLSDIKLLTGKKGYLYESVENSSEGSYTFTRGTYTSGYDHSVTLRIFKNTTEARAWINSMKDARVIVILENRESGETKWEVYGWECGLKLSENTGSTKFEDHVVAAPVLSSDDDSIESDLPYIFFKTDEATTEAAVLALCQAAAA